MELYLNLEVSIKKNVRNVRERGETVWERGGNVVGTLKIFKNVG